MAYHKPADLDGFIAQMSKSDMRIRAQLAEDLVSYLSDDENSIACMDLGLLIDGLVPWMNGSHYKIAQRALESYTELIGRLGHDFCAYTSTILPHVVDRLGDNRDTVREKAQLLLHKLMECKVLQPQVLLDKLTLCFKHKNSKVREEFLQTIVNALNEYGTQSLSVKSYIQPIVVLLGDPISTVRDAAIQTLVEMYKHVGDRLRIDLRKKDVPAAKMVILEQKFDEARQDGLLLPSALSTAVTNDEPDNLASAPRPIKLVKRVASASARKPLFEPPASSGDTVAGAVTAEIFEASFELVPQLTIFGQRDIDDHMKNIYIVIGDNTMDWEKRVDALKKIRSMLIINVQNSPSFPQQLKDLSIAFLDILKELRSQVIREACITIAYMSKLLRLRVDNFCIYILQEMINLIQNSAKIISSASIIALKYVIRFVHAPKIIPIITTNLLQSKSKDIRSNLCELMILIYEEWPTKALEKYGVQLRDALKKGISDADSDARKFSRRAFWGFRRHFMDMADQLYGALDSATQRSIEKERDVLGTNGTNSMSASLRGSNSSLNSMPGGVIKRRTSSGLRSPSAQPSTTSASTENLSVTRLHRVPSLPRSSKQNRSGIPVAKEPPQRAGFRSVSAVDTAAAQRARARAQYSNLARMKVTSGAASLQGQIAQQARSKKSTISSNMATPQQASPERQIRSRAGVSQSQPTSRSTSPSSRLRDNYSSYGYRQTGTVPKKTSGIPRSLANSRETSPSRGATTHFGTLRRNIYSSSPKRPERPPINPGRPVMAQKILQQSREAEYALADALSPDDPDFSSDFSRLALHRSKIARDESDESEASSVCSERSFDSLRRGNDTLSWSGSRSRLDSTRPIIEDMDTIIQYCASTHWSERKDGLISLTQYLSDGKMLTTEQLQRVLDLFRKMFLDPHIKVYTLFLDTVNELILSHSNDLHDWLFILLTRLFNKLGTELLQSMNTKIWKTLLLIHEYFPAELQMQCVFRILVDAAQTPNNKTKVATVKFLTDLAATFCTAAQFPTQPPAEKAIQRIVQYATDQKSIDLRSHSRSCLIALYNCNTPNTSMFLFSLPKPLQDAAKSIIQQHMRKGTSGNSSPSSPLSSPKPLLSPQQGGPYSLQSNSSPRSRQTSVEANDNMNTEEIYKNLRKTTAEIQNYSFESKLDRDTNSKDSGISQMGDGVTTHSSGSEQYSNGYNSHLGLDKEDYSCNGSKTQSATTTESNTPENTVKMDVADIINRFSTQSSHNFTFTDTGELITEKGMLESDIIKSAIELQTGDNPETIFQVLSNLSICIKYGKCDLPNKNFKCIMKMLLNLIQSTDPIVIIAAVRILGRILRTDEMKSNYIRFLELMLLKLIDCYKTNKEVSKEIDLIIMKIPKVLPLDASVNILNPVIATAEYPANLCALKLLLELIAAQGKDLTDHHLDYLMPNIARLTDDNQSLVRKTAVFCIVKLYVVMGEDKVKPKFYLLNSSKIRLLNVYIAKAIGTSNKTTS